MAEELAVSSPRKIEIGEITVDRDMQVRAGHDRKYIAELADVLKDKNKDLEPIILFRFETPLSDAEDAKIAKETICVEGHHRLAAYIEAGRHEIPYKTKSGSREEAILFAIDANLKHGQRMDREDKKRAMSLLLAMDEWKKATAQDLADKLRMSKSLAAELKKEIKDGETENRKATKQREKNKKARKALAKQEEELAATPDKPAEATMRELVETITHEASPAQQRETCLAIMDRWVEEGLIEADHILGHFAVEGREYVSMPAAKGSLPLTIAVKGGDKMTFSVLAYQPSTGTIKVAPLAEPTAEGVADPATVAA